MATMEKNARHPKGLYVLCTTEMWERFNFYGMRALFSLFLVNAMMYSERESSLIYGAFLGLSYLTPIIGGYISDNMWGNRKSIIVGGSAMAAGQFLLFLSGSIYADNLDFSKSVLWIALAFIILGNGLFKPNISSMVGQLYSKGDSRLDSAYTIFYMGINLGAFAGMFICPFLGDVHDASGVRAVSAFKWGFLAAGIAMLFGTFVFIFLKNKYLLSSNKEEIGGKPLKIRSDEQTSASFSKRSIAMGVVGFALVLSCFYYFSEGGFVSFIYSFVYASGLSLALFILFADRSLSREEKEKIIVLYIVSFFVIFFWSCFEQAGSSLTFIADYQTDRRFLGIDMPPSSIQNANSVFILILALPFAFLWRWIEKKKIRIIAPTKQAAGLLFLSAGYFLIAFQVKDIGISGKLAVIWLFLMYMLHTMGELCLSPIGLSLFSKLAPRRFVSLLMGVWFLANASGYALAGTLGGLLPPTGDKYIKAHKLGFALESVLKGEARLSPEQIELFRANDIPTAYPVLCGIPIENLYDFFMIFVCLSAAAGAALLLLTPLLKRMMHGAR